MPKLQTPLDITGVIGGGVESQNPQGDKTVTLLVQVSGGAEMPLRMTPEVAADIYRAVCAE
jgi:hypothetical protein